MVIKNKKTYGCVDFGFNPSHTTVTNDVHDDEDSDGENENKDKLPPSAKSSLVFMLVSLNESWKVPFAYFFIDSLRSQERCLLIQPALRSLEENSVVVRCLTFDGCLVNLTTAKKLGACVDVLSPKFKPYFLHPTSHENVYIFSDACHMINNARNSFAKTVIRNKEDELLYLYVSPMYDAENRKISWSHIEDLVNFQSDEGLRVANKLTKRHVKYKENIMNVRLAAQTLSHSTASGLRYLERKYIHCSSRMSQEQLILRSISTMLLIYLIFDL